MFCVIYDGQYYIMINEELTLKRNQCYFCVIYSFSALFLNHCFYLHKKKSYYAQHKFQRYLYEILYHIMFNVIFTCG